MRSWWKLALACTLTACRFDLPDDLCFGTGLVDNLCLAQPPMGTLSITGTFTLDTAMVGTESCTTIVGQTGGPSLCVVARETISVTSMSTLRVIGPNPLVLIATGTIEVSGTIDGSDYRDGPAGPGARITCGAQTAGQDASAGSMSTGGGGGAGGSFGGRGGAGGRGNNGPLGGDAGAAAPPVIVVGGCAGSRGGKGRGGNGGSPGGPGGGAIYAIARESIAISGTIATSGGGGKGGTDGGASGGGGAAAGSGGLIGLDAPVVMITGRLHANGGGGGGGAGDMADRLGSDGSDSTGPLPAAPGGPGGTGGGGAGGAGFAQDAPPLPGGNGSGTDSGGGGGGGGASVIRVFQAPAMLSSAISPAPT